LNRFFGIFSHVTTWVIALEQALPQSGLGQTKKEIILNGIEVAAKVGGVVGTALGQPEISAISIFIDQTVSKLNASGAFKSAAPVPATA
jgi:hypothetical protein